MAVVLKLDEFVEPPALNAAGQGNADWSEELPAISQLPATSVDLGTHTIEVPGIQRAIVRPNGKPIWAVRLHGVELRVECTAYTRWDDTWGKARGLLEQAYALVRQSQPDANVVEMNLVVGDRFVTDDERYTAAELFQRGSVVGDWLLQRGRIWHCNTGWLDEQSEFRLIHGLNIQVTSRPSSERLPAGPYTFNVTHSQQLSDPGKTLDFGRLNEIVSELHAGNKRVLTDLISPEMLKTIGLAA